MAVSLTINGTSYSFPNTGDQIWGDNVTNWATAVTSGMLQKAGGAFTLTADVNFGSSFGIISKYFTSVTANAAAAGAVRLAKTDSLKWRNNANSADIALAIDGSDNLTFAGVAIGQSSVASGGTGQTSYTTGDMLYATGSTTLAKLAIGSANKALISTGTAPSWALVSLTANVSGTLPIANGGTGQTAKTAAFDALQPMTTSGDIIYGGTSGTGTRLAKGTDGQFLKLASGLPAWTTFPVPTIQKFTSGSGTYTTPAGVIYIRVKASGGGGGGTGSGTTPGSPTAGNNTTFGSSLITCNGGSAASANVGGAGGSATATGLTGVVVAGGTGQGSGQSAVANVFLGGGNGGSNAFGGAGVGTAGAGAGGTAGGAGSTNSGAGGGGAGADSAKNAGAGGGAGGYVDVIIVSPSATYAYAVGGTAGGGSAGTGGQAGGAGAAGVIIVEEFYT